MKKYQELENKIAELQKEVERLEREEKGNGPPDGFNVSAALDFLEKPDVDNLDQAFTWDSTPQRHEYWVDIRDNLECSRSYKVPLEAIVYVQKCVIRYYQQQQEMV